MQTTTKSTFKLDSEVIAVLKEGVKNADRFADALKDVRENAFIYNFGATTLTEGERGEAAYLLNKIGRAIELCTQWKQKPDSQAVWAIYNTVGYLTDAKPQNKRFSDTDMVHEIFNNTFHHKWANGDYLNTVEVIPAMELFTWFNDLYYTVSICYEHYQKENN